MALTLLVGLSVLFAVTHIGLSHGRIREGMVEKLGEWPFRGLYSAVSVVTLGGAAAVLWKHRGLGPVLWRLPPALAAAVALILMFIAFELFALALATPSPAGMMPARAEARGVLRITRHPMNMAFACFGLAHAAANGTLGDASFFGSLFVVGCLGAFHQDRRKSREDARGFREFQAQTSVLPFVAILSGRTRLERSELSLPMILAAALAFAAVAGFHRILFGVPVW